MQTILTMDDIPVATACVQFFQALGSAVFIAVAQTLFQNGIVRGVSSDPTLASYGIDPLMFINSGASEVRGILEAMGAADAIPAVLEAYMGGIRDTIYVSVAAAAAAFVAAAGLKWRSVKKPVGGAPSGPSAV